MRDPLIPCCLEPGIWVVTALPCSRSFPGSPGKHSGPPANAGLSGITYCGCQAAILASPARCWEPKPSADVTKCPLGADSARAEKPWFNGALPAAQQRRLLLATPRDWRCLT